MLQQINKKPAKNVRFSSTPDSLQPSSRLATSTVASTSSEKIKVPRSLILHKKNKSNDYARITKLEVPSVNEVLARILSSSNSPIKARTESRIDDLMLCIPKAFSSFSPTKLAKLKKQRQNSRPSHLRSMSPLKPFNDRIFHLKRWIGK
jgi:hypothetical protein